jgi:hypothetical protein
VSGSTCLHHAITLQRRSEPRDWPAALQRVPAECRAECEEYLRGIADRLRTLRNLRHQSGAVPRSTWQKGRP